MILELFATFCVGLGTAGVMLALSLMWPSMPRWLVPALGGLAMILFTIWSEYSWAGRTMDSMPEGLEVIETRADKFPFKPWTYPFPQTTRILAVDTTSVQTKPEAPGVVLVDLYLFARWRATTAIPQFVNCDAPARADVSDAALADPAAAKWFDLGDADPLITAVCT
ncbi:MAG: hypothetical protein CML66_15095 [Rhodobacteraceae bacterium]|nr:hypothetical protein [Paracoccaceae bacterium]MAY45883.1 hypothetical protein [Paracoccaceae bacterium]QEW18351.1 hypothetical protein LA6_000513 [Marinibacterium anthonyi]